MTVAAITPSIDYLENGITLAFAAPFRFLPGSLAVSRRLVSGAVVALVAGVDYSVTGGATDAGGTVTLTASIAGARLLIRRRTTRAQAMDYAPGDRFPAESHEAALDRAMLIAQEQDVAQLKLDTRALKVPDGEIAAELPATADRVGRYFAWDATGRPVSSAGTGADLGLRQDLAAVTGASLVQKGGGGTLQDVADITDNFTVEAGILKSQTAFSLGMAGVLQGLWGGGFENNSRFYVANPIGRCAVAGFTRSSDNPTVGDMGTYALGAFVEHDSNKYAYGQYTEIRRRPGAGAAHGQEITLVNFGTAVDVDPYNPYASDLTDVLRLSTGRGDTPTQTNISAYLHLVSVGGAKALRGINIGSDAVAAIGGQADAVNLASGHAIQWWTGLGARGARIRSDTTNPAAAMRLIFANGAVVVQDFNSNSPLSVYADRCAFGVPVVLAAYTKATKPSAAALAYSTIIISNDASSRLLATSDGTNWRYQDGTVVPAS